MSTLCISFITSSGTLEQDGQGTQLLLYRPLRGMSYDRRGLTIMSVENLPPEIPPPAKGPKPPPRPTTLQLAEQSIIDNTHLSPKQDLRLIRRRSRSRLLHWQKGTMLEVFLFRLTPENEALFFSEARYELDARLGGMDHAWISLEHTVKHGVEHDLVATALRSVCLPTEFNNDLLSLMEAKLDSRGVAILALASIFTAVKSRVARGMFKTHPYHGIPLPEGGGAQAMREKLKRFKTSLLCYWTDVLAWHLKQSRPDASSAVTFSCARALSPVTSAIQDPEMSIELFEQLAMRSISVEIERLKHVETKQIQNAVHTLLWDRPKTEGVKDGRLNVVVPCPTEPILHSVVQIIRRVLEPRTHIFADEDRTLPSHLHIVVSESRPTLEGVRFAQALLSHVLRGTRERARYHSRRSDPFTYGSPDSSSLHMSTTFTPETQALMQRLEEAKLWATSNIADDAAIVPNARPSFLSHNGDPALAAAYALLERKAAEGKVTVEIVTDSSIGASLAACAGAAKQESIVVLCAERVTPTADVIQASGGAGGCAMLAKVLNVPVFALARIDQIQADGSDGGLLGKNMPSDDVFRSWSGDPGVNELIKATEVISISHRSFEKVPGTSVTCVITEAGPLDAEHVKDLAQKRAELEKSVWG